jgi:L-threonylcarbamoyladenylate synthase
MERQAAKALLQPRAVIVLPTDTVYGLVARAVDKPAVERLYRLKDRVNKPGTVIAANIEQLVSLGITRRYLKAVEQYWPGPVSVIIPVSNPKLNYLTSGAYGLAIRLPDAKPLLALLKQTGPLMTTSANLPGQPVAVTIDQAKAYFHNQVDAYIDGGPLIGRRPSTIIRVVDDAIEVVRQGAMDIRTD